MDLNTVKYTKLIGLWSNSSKMHSYICLTFTTSLDWAFKSFSKMWTLWVRKIPYKEKNIEILLSSQEPMEFYYPMETQ